MAITGVHPILYTRDADADRAGFAEVLGLESADVGGGWLSFALPRAEPASHPASVEGGDIELHLMSPSRLSTPRQQQERADLQTAH